MLFVFTIVVVLIVVYCQIREGLFTATLTLINVLLAGLITFNFWEPAATMVEAMVERSPVQGYEDFAVLILMYSVCFGVLRGIANSANRRLVEFMPAVNQVGAGAVAVFSGYLLSGFLICAMETLPWYQNFLGFAPYAENEPPYRRYLPPERLWLALMHRAGAAGLSRGDDMPTFDQEGTFESNYLRLRRYPEPPSDKK